MVKLMMIIGLIFSLSGCYRSCKSLDDSMAMSKKEKYECVGWREIFGGKTYINQVNWGGGYYVKIRERERERVMEKYTKRPKYNTMEIKTLIIWRVEDGITSCQDPETNLPTTKCLKFLEITSPYPYSCNEDKAFDEMATILPVTPEKAKSKFWRTMSGTPHDQRKKIQKTCTPTMTQEKLDYLRKLWVKQYMIDAYPEIYPEAKEKYLTKDEMALVEKMYELE